MLSQWYAFIYLLQASLVIVSNVPGLFSIAHFHSQFICHQVKLYGKAMTQLTHTISFQVELVKGLFSVIVISNNHFSKQLTSVLDMKSVNSIYVYNGRTLHIVMITIYWYILMQLVFTLDWLVSKIKLFEFKHTQIYFYIVNIHLNN